MAGHRLLYFTLILTAGCSPSGDRDTSRSAPAEAPASTPAAAPAVVNEPPPSAETQATPGLVVGRTDDLPTPVGFAPEDWPQFRGLQRDAKSRETGFSAEWPADGPPVVWRVEAGQGYASPSVVDSKVYLNDYDESRNTWMVRSLDLESGDELWRYEVAKRIRPNHAITRTAPATDGGFLFAIDPKCELHCLDARNGDLLWKLFLPEVYGATIPPWYNGQCPLLDGDRVVLATGGRALLAAFDKATGEPVWETPNPNERTLTHASVMPIEVDGVKQYACLTMQGAYGVEAESGSLLWEFPWQFNTAVPTSPLLVDDGLLMLTSAYHARTAFCRVTHDGDAWVAEEATSLPPPTRGWNSEVHTPILHRGKIFGVGKKQRGLWTCLDREGAELWTSRGKASFGMGGYVYADGKFYVLEGKTGVLRVLDAEADEYRELAACTVLEGPDVWAPPVISRGRLLVRDLTQLVCLDLRAGPITIPTETVSHNDVPPAVESMR